MKTFFIAIVLLSSLVLPAIAMEQVDYSYPPLEYTGFVEYQGVDANGHPVFVKTPVRYRMATNRDYAEDDSNNAVRDCRIELERAKQAKEESERKQFK